MILGEAIKHYNVPRFKLVISKCFQFVDEDKGPIDPATLTSNDSPRVNRVGLSRKHILDAVDQSVERLGTYIADPQDGSGKVRYIGASSMAAWGFQILQNVAHQNGWHKFISMQGLYSLLRREEERNESLLQLHWRRWNRYSRAEVSLPKLLFRGEDQNTHRALVDRVEEFAQRKGVEMAQIAESWLIAKGCMPICGLESEERIDQAVGAVQVKLSDEEMKYLEELYVPKVSFPF
ncbi:hypothetical protein FVEG_03186 [Fusarium verticillioides 7600]|uniref:NADP-dependent oxidoreductase domain-containing protein n=1 Tax=Gibberella moniliformis (strain M3125 / FGSC 7600) TaxID=334819 RepID=W7M7V8_GIBM7|nr:hypothetical protein FVEG_03186 [Fusarium verticillioides 7600]EWG40982.1 hypothetical protein FVEG_03186 [Fusarium verticillioides 7600]